MFTIACCDDDPIWLQEFAGLLQPILQKHQVPYRLHTSACGGDLLEAVASRALSPDLLFLDVLLGEENGLDVAAALRRTLPDLSIVLVSCSPDFALDGYKVHPLDSLVKPIRPEELEVALLLALNRRQKPVSLAIRSGDMLQVVSVDSILYAEVFDTALHIHTVGGGVVSSSGHLSTLAQRLPALQFLRCHKSYLVNLSHAVGLRRYCFRLTDGSSVPVSKKNYTQVQQSFLHYCEENLGLR